MKKVSFLISLFILFACSLPFAVAQVKYYNADQFPLIGKVSDETETRYERLPSRLKEISRDPVWKLGKNTAGLAIRFRTNSTSVSAKWTVLMDRNMNHMTDTGIKGLDLYAWEGNQWRFVNSARPKGKTNDARFIAGMTPEEREYMLFLPLYDGIVSLEIGVDDVASIGQPTLNSPNSDRPVIVYGTSITQGGCATRPGMAYTNILTRKLHTEVINLGFSGNGRLDYEIAEIMALQEDAALYVIDCLPNVTPVQIEERLVPFVDIIRAKNKEIPILFVENIEYTTTVFDQNRNTAWNAKNAELSKQFEILKEKGHKNIYYLDSENLIGTDGEGTVDGTHLTDVGFMRIADALYGKIKLLAR